ncbi:hypothetical protein Dcar01_01785 [Deinococcus carri]|uniref:J domain-containing protein n=1 Tax=Deinococcus carri TaxID=1211323 RepID=A0ABP9W6S4_9DEIO
MTSPTADLSAYDTLLGVPHGAPLPQVRAAFSRVQAECQAGLAAGGEEARQAAQRLEAAEFALAQLEAHLQQGRLPVVADVAAQERARLGCLAPVALLGSLLLFTLWPKGAPAEIPSPPADFPVVAEAPEVKPTAPEAQTPLAAPASIPDAMAEPSSPTETTGQDSLQVEPAEEPPPPVLVEPGTYPGEGAPMEAAPADSTEAVAAEPAPVVAPPPVVADEPAPPAEPPAPVAVPAAAPVAPPAAKKPQAAPQGYFTVGDTKDDVLRVMGQPSDFGETHWTYGINSVNFSGGKVQDWSNIDGTLKAKLVVPSGKNKGYFTMGDTKDDVLRVMGQPSDFGETHWTYGINSVNFSGGKVQDWSNIDGTLKAKLVVPPGKNKGYFTVGDTKDDVLRVMGQPSDFGETHWNYGINSVNFSAGQVIDWSNIDGTLKAKLVVPPGKNKGYFTVGDTKDDVLRVMGQPSDFGETHWTYGINSVNFSAGKVTDWSNIDGTLKARLE